MTDETPGTSRVELGDHTYNLVPQPHAVVLRRFPKIVQGLSSIGEGLSLESMEDLVEVLDDKIYDVLKLFIPDLMSKHEFMGYETKAAMEANEWDEEYASAHVATLPQLFDAFDVAMEVNGGKRLKDLLGNVLGPELTRAMRSIVTVRMRQELLKMSQSLPSTVDGSEPLTSSGQSDPTQEPEMEEENEGSPSLASLT